MTIRALTIALGFALAGAAFTTADAQPARERAGQRGPDIDPSPEQVRTFLERRLDATRENEAALAALLERLDAGEDPEAVARDAREIMRDALAPLRELAGDRPGGPPGDRRPLEGEPTMEELFDLLAEVDAPMRERLRRLAKDNPERARAILRRAAPELRELAQLKRDDPEAFRLRLAMMQAGRDAWRAAAQHRRAERDGAGDDELTRRREEIADAVRRRVEIEQMLKAREIERLAERVETLRTDLSANSERIDEIVAEQTERLVERAEHRRGGRGPDGGPRP